MRRKKRNCTCPQRRPHPPPPSPPHSLSIRPHGRISVGGPPRTHHAHRTPPLHTTHPAESPHVLPRHPLQLAIRQCGVSRYQRLAPPPRRRRAHGHGQSRSVERPRPPRGVFGDGILASDDDARDVRHFDELGDGWFLLAVLCVCVRVFIVVKVSGGRVGERKKVLRADPSVAHIVRSGGGVRGGERRKARATNKKQTRVGGGKGTESPPPGLLTTHPLLSSLGSRVTYSVLDPISLRSAESDGQLTHHSRSWAKDTPAPRRAYSTACPAWSDVPRPSTWPRVVSVAVDIIISSI